MASFSSAPSETDSVGPSGVAPPQHEIIFPPDDAALQAIALQCDRGLCPFRIGHNVSVHRFNQWLASDSEDGLRVDYDEVNKQVVVREAACITSHGITRAEIRDLLKGIYRPHGYVVGLGRIITPPGRPNLSPDAHVGCVLPTGANHDVIALEVCLPYNSILDAIFPTPERLAVGTAAYQAGDES